MILDNEELEIESGRALEASLHFGGGGEDRSAR